MKKYFCVYLGSAFISQSGKAHWEVPLLACFDFFGKPALLVKPSGTEGSSRLNVTIQDPTLQLSESQMELSELMRTHPIIRRGGPF